MIKNKLNYLATLLLVVLSLSFSGCDDDEDPPAPPSNNIADIVSSDSRFTTLLAALQEAGLVETFSGDTPYTVFAPTDDAFNAYLSANGLTATDLLNSPDLAGILQYHVVQGAVQSSALSNGPVETLTGENVYVNVNNGVVINGKSTVTSADVAADNGVIHVIDAVLEPAAGSVVDIAAGNDDFSTLVGLLQQYGLDAALAADGPFTVFAPTNAAFDKIADVLPTLSQEEVEAILRFHVIPDRAFSSDLTTQRYATLNDAKGIDVEVSGGTITVNGTEEINPATANINATNGVIHVIDDVLLPPQTIAEVVTSDERFATLLAAVGQAELVTLLSSDGPFTVFAPTDEAFTAYLEKTGLTAEELLASDQLADILQYHVVPGEVLSTALSNGGVATAGGDTIFVNVNDGVVINGNSTVIDADVDAYNGVIHVIDAVLEPAPGTIVDIAAGNENFTQLVALLQQYGLDAALAGDGPFTVFAPTDEAFEKISAVLPTLTDAEIEDILKFHVVPARAFSSDLMTQDYPTLNERRPLSVDLTQGIVINGTEEVLPANANINATNGVIHVIDDVLLPRRSVVDRALYNESFSILVEALIKTELVTVLDTLEAAKATVFAPTNTAFEAALDALGFATLDDVPVDLLGEILLHHVIFEETSILSTDLEDGVFYPTVNGAAIKFNANGLTFTDGQDNDVPLNAGLLDLEESNGVVHVLDGVLQPPTQNIVEITLAQDPEFSTLVSLLQRVELVSTLSDVDADFTVFAPTNQAFTDLGIDPETLTDEEVTDILLYHVVGERVFSSDLSDQAEVTTLSNDATFIVNIGNTVTITDNSEATADDATVTTTDIQGTNGVIHIIDKVILP
mgnify:CR=1 FL=1